MQNKKGKAYKHEIIEMGNFAKYTYIERDWKYIKRDGNYESTKYKRHKLDRENKKLEYRHSP